MDRKQQASDLRTNALNQIRAAQADSNLSPEGKARTIQTIRTEANNKIKELRQTQDRERSEQRESAFRKAFGLSLPASATSSDRSFARMSYRDAIFKASTVKNQDEAGTLLDVARMTGDKELEKALGLKAYQNSWTGILDEYASTSADVADAIQEITHWQSSNGTKDLAAEQMHFTSIAETPEERTLQTFRNAA